MQQSPDPAESAQPDDPTLPSHLLHPIAVSPRSEPGDGSAISSVDAQRASVVQWPRLSRRRLFTLAGVGAGVVAVGAGAVTLLADPALPTLLLLPANDRDTVTQVLNRVTFGPRPGMVADVGRQGIGVYLEAQLFPESIADDACERRLAAYKTLNMTAAQMYAANVDDYVASTELDGATVLRAMYSRRQLNEVVVGFWTDHFSIWHRKDRGPYLKTVDDREVIRAHAFGLFRALLGASAASPAMLDYLDNWLSVKEHPNENYARELLELHTLGVGEYTERDVREVARCFTGWTFEPDDAAYANSFVFDANIHDDGTKVVLGHTIAPGGGRHDGEAVLDILAAHPATARRIATKLCRRFIADDPPAAAVAAVAHTFYTSGGDMRRVLRTLFARDEFLHAPPKFKRPLEYVYSLLRAFDVQLSHDSTDNLLTTLDGLGQRPFDHPTPEGYSDRATRWMGNLLTRWNVGVLTAYGQMGDGDFDLIKLAHDQGASTARQVIDFYTQHLLGHQLSATQRDTLWQFFSANGEPDLNTDEGSALLADAVALLAASPASQYR